MSKQSLVYMVHEINQDIIDRLERLDSSHTITLDDGLLTQFLNKDYLKKFQKVIFFINPTIICPATTKQNYSFITCRNAHKKAFNNCFENYMTLDQILELQNIDNFEIGSHFQNHIYFKNIKEMLHNAQESLIFFNNNNIKIKSFCLPYNQDRTNKIFINAFKLKYPDMAIYGNSRIAIESI